MSVNLASRLLERIQQIPDNDKKGGIFEEAVCYFLLHSPMFAGEFIQVLRWHEWPGRGEERNGIDLIAIDRNGRPHAIQAKHRHRCSSIGTMEVVSFVESVTKYYSLQRPPELSLTGALFITSKPTLAKRHHKTMRILTNLGLRLQTLVRQDLVVDDSWVRENLLDVAGCPRGDRKGSRSRAPVASKPRLVLERIAYHISTYHQETAEYPNRESGPVVESEPLTWAQVDNALKKAGRGLPYMGSLKLFISSRFQVRHPKHLLPLSEEHIVSLAKDHYTAFGKWPTGRTKEILEGQNDGWQAICSALNMGARGLPGNDSLGALLARHKCQGVRKRGGKLSIGRIVQLARAHHAVSGKWPNKQTPGDIADGDGETWKNIDKALREQQKRIDGINVFTAQAAKQANGQTSLAALLYIHCAVESHTHKHTLDPEVILAAADQFRNIHGRWPSESDATMIPDLEKTMVSWNGLGQRLRHGYCGLPGGSSLRDFFRQYRPDDPELNGLPTVTYRELCRLVRAHRQKHGTYPTRKSGSINGFNGLTWEVIDNRLRVGSFKLPKNSSLARLLEAEFPEAPANRANREAMRLSLPEIAEWLRTFVNLHHRFPNRRDGSVPNNSRVKWGQIASSLNMGTRGLPKGLSLSAVAREHGIVRPMRTDKSA